MYKFALDLKVAFCTDSRFAVCCTGEKKVQFTNIYQGSCARLRNVSVNQENAEVSPCRGYSQLCDLLEQRLLREEANGFLFYAN